MNKFDKETKITVITGAGFSQASGVPTFRGKDGLWKNYNAADLATPHAFNNDPKLVWEWYKWRLGIVLNAKPNAGHLILAEVEAQGCDIAILTQNVDDLHERAGSKNVIHLHGEIRQARCVGCGDRFSWTLDLLETTEEVPKCNSCSSLYRPDVIWFYESLNHNIIQSCFDRLSSTDLLIVAGTSMVVYPVAEFPFLARQRNPSVKIFEFNLDYTPISNITSETIIGPVEKTLPKFFGK